MDWIDLYELEQLAQQQLPPMAWDYIAGGAGDERTLVENVEAFQRIRLRPRVLRDVSQRSLTTRVLGMEVMLPVLLAPTSFQRLCHPEGELATAQAAAAAGTINISGTGAHYRVAEVAAAGGPLWFQIYCYAQRSITERLIRRAEEAGCLALVLTVDATTPPRRKRLLRTPLQLPPEITYGNLVDAGLSIDAWPNVAPLQQLTWDDLRWLRSLTSLPLVLKGVMTAEDALLGVEHGVEAIVVSNHGGRQLDGTLPTIEALPAIVAAVAGQAEVLLDGGVRSGADIVKALALGARAVLIGRPYLWGLAVGGAEGVRAVLDLLRVELDDVLAQLGRRAVSDLTPDVLTLPHQRPW